MPVDRSLLDRLNALKPTSVSLDTQEPNPSILRTGPAPEEDALSARLRTLRNTSASPRHETLSRSPGLPTAQPPLDRHISSSPLSQDRILSRSSEPKSPPVEENVDLDALLHDGDMTAEEVLDSLGFDIPDDFDPEQPPPWSYDPTDESKKVAALLEELKPPTTEHGPSREHAGADDHDDDSDGEEMSSQIRQVLSRALDEAELDRLHSSSADDPQQQPEAKPPAPDPKQEANPTSTPRQPGPENEPEPSPKADKAETETAADADPFSLPTVPSQLLDPVPDQGSAQGNPSLDFEDAIAARIAALRGLGSGGSSAKTDSFGLPSVPTFQPDEHTPTGSKSIGKSKGGYTDEDQMTWCIVCLEDATIRCVGCDGDVYCRRCWKDMHVGPRAGYDERGHQWVRFERDK